ncbi:hypothetical protein RI367_005169 [Sorochytrium milnesiophthora]
MNGLPAEIVTHIAALCGVRTCALLRHLPALRLILGAYTRGRNRSTVQEGAAIKVLLRYRWSAGVQAVLDAGIYRMRRRDIALWRHMKLTPASIKRLWSTPDCDAHCVAALVYNVIETLDDGAKDFLQSIDALRNLERRTGLYVDECELARCYITDATRLGLVEIVRYFAKPCQEMLVERSLPFEVAATGGCQEIVKLLSAPALTTCTMHQSLSYAMYHAAAGNSMEEFNCLSEQRPGYMSMFANKELARHGHIAILKQSWHDDPDLWSTDIINEATQGAFEGNQIEWIDQLAGLDVSQAFVGSVIESGNVDLVAWLFLTRPHLKFHVAQFACFSKYAMINAVRGGHIDP